MHRMNRKRAAVWGVSVGLLFALAVTLSPIGPGSRTTEAATVLGGVNFDGYCRSIGRQGAQLINWNAGGWRCYQDVTWNWGIASFTSRYYSSIDASAACRYTYGRSNAVARYRNWYDPYSWYCVV